MKHGNKWNYMLHGSLFLRYTGQNFNNSGKKGSDSKFSAPNWVSGYGTAAGWAKRVAEYSRDGFLDRVFDGALAIPCFFSRAESWKGKPLIDRQHPHDLISELSVAYTQRVNDKIDLTVYAISRRTRIGSDRVHAPDVGIQQPRCRTGPPLAGRYHIITFGVVTAGVSDMASSN